MLIFKISFRLITCFWEKKMHSLNIYSSAMLSYIEELIKLTDPRSQKPLPKMKGPKAVPAAKKE